MSVVKHQLPCCALCQITASDDDSLEVLTVQIEKTQQEALLKWNPKDRVSGERACFVITTPSETNLQTNLTLLGFTNIVKFPRRNGYPQDGLLMMWFKSW